MNRNGFPATWVGFVPNAESIYEQWGTLAERSCTRERSFPFARRLAATSLLGRQDPTCHPHQDCWPLTVVRKLSRSSLWVLVDSGEKMVQDVNRGHILQAYSARFCFRLEGERPGSPQAALSRSLGADVMVDSNRLVTTHTVSSEL